MEGAGLPREGGQVSPSPILGLWRQAPPAKKTKKAVLFFEVEILDARTREKLCFLDKVPGAGAEGGTHTHTCPPPPCSPVPLGGVRGWGKGKLRHGLPRQPPDGLSVARRWSPTPPSPRSRASSPRPVRTDGDGDGDAPPGTSSCGSWRPSMGWWGPSSWLGTHPGAAGICVAGWWGPSSWPRTCHGAIVVTVVTRDPSRGLGDPHRDLGPFMGP